jgi:hypothetical protein
MEADTRNALAKLTPAEKLAAIEFLVTSLRSISNHDSSSQNQNLRRLLEDLGNLPVHNLSDGFKSSDHDREIYRDKP